jgi:sugar phosphate isomerase/epimerase
MDRLGLDMLSVFGMPPVDYVRLAADLGCGHITVSLVPLPWNPCGFPSWSLREDAALRREMQAALRDLGVAVTAASGFALRAEADVREQARDMDLAAELGARQAASVGMDPDLARAHDQLAILTEMAVDRGLEVVLDYAPHQAINNLQGALAALRHTGSPHALLSVDAMHVFRSGGTAAELAALDPRLIGYAQICDAPRAGPLADYGPETLFARKVPGEGELPLADFIAALPPEVAIGVEVPIRAEVEKVGLRPVIQRAVAASRRLLAAAGPGRPQVV